MFLRDVILSEIAYLNIEVARAKRQSSDAQVMCKVDPSLNNEALRIINSMPRWIPGQQGGKNVRTRYTLTLPFRLQ